MGHTHHYWCPKCEKERGVSDWWPNWFPAPCPGGGHHDWQWKKREPLAKLEGAQDLLEKRAALLTKNILTLEGQARAEVHKGTPQAKKQAMALLKKKKVFEDNLAKLGAQQNNLQALQDKLEEADFNKQSIAAQLEAAKALKKLNVDKVEDVLDQIRETMQQADEISQVLCQPLADDAIDEGELLAELEELEAMDSKEELAQLQVPVASELAKHEGQQLEDDAEAELRALEAELATA
eukprot:GGOE01013675.1.p1 GENE.GGOE01013675.1~~GGOE01013675.1.p1  ORF type:complete len:257 (-),score=74.65 GGOE01013675.1:161-871(-)